MITSPCICRKSSRFTPLIEYRNETVFKAFEGTVIGKCIYCPTLKTFPAKQNTIFDPINTKADLYEKRNRQFIRLFTPLVARIVRFMKRGSVLDVGCSTGILLSLFKKKGFDVAGVEPNAYAYAIARKKLGSRILRGTLSTYLLKKGKPVDCIVYNHVLEHIQDWRKEFSQIGKILKPGGILVVGLPNTANFIFRVRGKYWESLQPNEHIWHMNTKSLCGLLESNGFSIQSVSYEDDGRASYPLLKRLYFGALSLVNRILGTGEAVLIIAKNKG